eukprot:3713572-Pleurochrysis_carterae.AAC.1
MERRRPRCCRACVCACRGTAVKQRTNQCMYDKDMRTHMHCGACILSDATLKEASLANQSNMHHSLKGAH